MKKALFFVLGLLLVFVSVPTFAETQKASTVNLTVVFKDGQIPTNFKSTIQKKNGTVIAEFPSLGAVEVHGSADLINTLQSINGVQAVSPTIIHSLPKVKKFKYNKQTQMKYLEDTEVDPSIQLPPKNFPLLHHLYQWDIKRVTNNGESYKLEKGNHDVVVGIIDTGVDTDHPDLVMNFLGGRNYVPVGGVDGSDSTETGDLKDFEDRNGHGTHVAGTIAGNGMILGVAPNIGFKSYRVFGAEGGASTATVAQAIMGASDDGVDVISMSLGGYTAMGRVWWTDKQTGKTYNLGNEVADFLLYKRAVKYATDHGVTVVAAAGNEGLDVTNHNEVNHYLNEELGPQGYKFVGAAFEAPGSVPGVITVSATGPDDIRAAYSNYGAGFTDVTAPGGGIERYPYGSWYTDLCLSSYLNGDYVFMAGTSMATPKVAAVAALYIAKDGKMSPIKVAQKVKESAEEVGQTGTDQYFGNGMVQAPHNPEKLGDKQEWENLYGGIDMDGGVKVKQAKDGGYAVLGNTISFTKGDLDQDLYLVKTYPDGRVEWHKTFGKLGDDFATDILVTKDGGFLVVGSIEDPDNRQGDISLIKLNKDGNEEWEKHYHKDEHSLKGSSVVESDNGYVIAGSDGEDVYLGKFDLNGNVVWEKTYGGSANDAANVVKATSDGGYIIGGETYSNDGFTHKKDYYLLKVNGEGTTEWEKMFGEEWRYENINDIEVTDDGGLMVVGSEAFRVWGGFIPNDIPNIYYAKFNTNGTKLWEKIIGEEETYEEGLAITKTKNGSYMIAGAMEVGELNKDIYVLEIDENGKSLNEYKYGGEFSDFATDIEPTKEGGYVITGNTKSNAAGFPESDRDMFLIKLSK